MALGVGLYFSLPFEPPLSFLFISPFVVGLLFLFRQTVFLAALLALTLGFNAAQLEARSLGTVLLDQRLPTTSMTGLLYRTESLPEGTRLTLKNPSVSKYGEKKPLSFVRVKVHESFRDLPPAGSLVNLWGPLWPPGEPVLPGGYDFRRHAFFKQISASGFSYGALRLLKSEPLPLSSRDHLYLFLEKTRRLLSTMAFERLPADEAPMTSALLTGSQASIDKDVMRAMRLSGLSHLLSISGVHVSMIALLLYVPFRAFLALFPWIALRWPIKKISAAISILGTSLYTLLVGADAPTVRSALMTGIVMFAILTDRKAMSLRLVMVAALFIILAAPSSVMGPSFQMSFAAVLAMVAAYEKRLDAAMKTGIVFELPAWIAGFWKQGRDILLTSLIATAATTPFTLYHFQNFSFYGVIANMVAIPLTTLWVMPCLLLVYLTAPLDLAGWFLSGAGLGIKATIWIAETVAAWPFSQFFMPPMPDWAFGLFVLGGLWVCLWQGRIKWFGVLPLLIACLYPLTVTAPSVLIAPDGSLWGVRLEDGRLAVFGEKQNRFILSQWQQNLQNAEAVFYSPNALPNDLQELTCEKESCLYTHQGFSMIFLMKKAKKETREAACAGKNQAVMAPFSLPNCRIPIVIDKTALDSLGAHSLTFTRSGPQIKTVRKPNEQRPWTASTQYLRTNPTNLP